MGDKKIEEAGKKVYDMMKKELDAITEEFEEYKYLHEVVKDIAIVMKIGAATKEGKVVMAGKTSKAPSVMEALGRSDYKFIITLNASDWMVYSDEQKRAELCHCICAISVKFNEKEELKLSIRKPDLVGFYPEFKRHELWREKPGGGSYPAPIEAALSDDGE